MRRPNGFLSLAGPLLLALCLSLLLDLGGFSVSAQQDSTCTVGRPCAIGCCSKEGQCGFTSEHCGTGCTSNCNSTAECGQWALPDDRNCPINSCCSKHGFCGTTEGFCGDGCQKNSNGEGCGLVTRPQCSIDTNALKYKRRIAYYELFTKDRECGRKEPASLPLGPLTHVNLAFVNFNSDFQLDDNDGDWISRIVARKIKYSNLRINIAIGGWVFNDPPTATYWSDMASTKENRAKFIKSCISFLRKYGLDGVDLDWEYPTANDRGGKKGDAENYVTLVKEMRAEFNGVNADWEITATLPTSYWYLKGFDVKGMHEHLSYINLMSYDIHGMWDRDNEWTGPWLRGHTEWTEIDEGLDLLWRNNVKPENVVMGFAFYGRSFTMADPSCHKPNGICKFATGGTPGDCSGERGVLTYQEIASRNNSLDVGTFYDPETTVKYNVYGGNQWVSYDDAQSFEDKKKRLSERCLGGLMIWAIDQDTTQWDAMGGLFGDYGATELEGLSRDSAEKLHDIFGQFNGQDCFVTEHCTDGSDGQRKEGQVCPKGFGSVETAHAPLQAQGKKLGDKCSKGWYRHICCPQKSMPKNCKWDTKCGGQKGSSCAKGAFRLNQDSFTDAKGTIPCLINARSLCCDSTELFSDCFWTDCDGEPRQPPEHPSCPSDFEYVAHRLNNADGSRWCSDHYYSNGQRGAKLHTQFVSSLCCPKGRSFSKCHWSNEPTVDPDSNKPAQQDYEVYCKPSKCRANEVKLADALDPPPAPHLGHTRPPKTCDALSVGAGFDAHFPLCCEPPSDYNDKWPVDPSKLWKEYWNNPKEDEVAWKYANNYKNNDEDKTQSNADEADGDDAYGFMMLNGPKGAIDNDFAKTQTIVRRFKEVPKVKRELLTSNRTLIDSVFDHAEEVLHVYCNYPAGSPECDEIFFGGAVDTIITLPDHVGEGPFARIVSMELAAPEFQLPAHHQEHRLEKRLSEQPVYEVKIDYNFHLIEARADSKPVNIRVDYTNLLGYWDELTDSSPSRVKRGMGTDRRDDMNAHDFRSRVQRGVARDDEAKRKRRRRRSATPVKSTTPFGTESAEALDQEQECKPIIGKRWWGTFLKWLDELTTVREGEKGTLPLGWYDKINLFKAQWGCPGQTFSANLRMDLEAEVSMDATYAYYLSARFVPPQKPDAFFYFGVDPTAYLGLVLKGNARMQTSTGRRKIVDTLAYPGLAVKGIAAVGPTLDVYGEIQGSITLKGEAKAGAKLGFGKAEVYWPQDDSALEKYDKILNLDAEKGVPSQGLEPTFEAGVEINAAINVIVTPEANVGIKIGGGTLTAGRALVDAQITGWLQGILSFQASGKASTTTQSFDYRYGAYIFYNVGFRAKAVILEWANWATKDRTAYKQPLPRVTIYEKEGSIDLSGGGRGRRSLAHSDYGAMSADPAWEVEASLRKRATNSGTGGATFTQNLQCPPGIDDGPKLPALRLNCGAFPRRSFGNAYESKSHCDNAGYQTAGIFEGIVLTHDTNKKRTQQRRNEQCTKDKKCGAQQKLAITASGVSTLELQCDEFPQGGSEEGGNFLDRGRSTLCVPSYQNSIHGQCVKLLTSLRTNVGALEPSVPRDQRVDQFIQWDDAFWYTDGAVKGSARQRFTDYDQVMPIPAGFMKNQRGTGVNSWTFKRNYTFDIVDDGSDGYAWWDEGQSVTLNNPKKTLAHPNPWDNVICAINIFDEDEYYEYGTSGGQPTNALCLIGPLTNLGGWPDSYSHANCYVEFEPLTRKAKRSKQPWTIKSVTYGDPVIIDDGSGDGQEMSPIPLDEELLPPAFDQVSDLKMPQSLP